MSSSEKVPKHTIALEHLARAIELYLRGDSYYSALHLGGAAEEILAVYVSAIQLTPTETLKPAFEQYKEAYIALSSPASVKESIATEKWIYKRMTDAKNSVKHKMGKNDNTVQFDPKEEAYDQIDRAISTYFQLLEHDNLPYIEGIKDFDAKRRAERSSSKA